MPLPAPCCPCHARTGGRPPHLPRSRHPRMWHAQRLHMHTSTAMLRVHVRANPQQLRNQTLHARPLIRFWGSNSFYLQRFRGALTWLKPAPAAIACCCPHERTAAVNRVAAVGDASSGHADCLPALPQRTCGCMPTERAAGGWVEWAWRPHLPGTLKGVWLLPCQQHIPCQHTGPPEGLSADSGEKRDRSTGSTR